MLEALRWIRADIALAGADSEKGSELVASKRLLSVFYRFGMIWAESIYDQSAEAVIVRNRDDFLNKRFANLRQIVPRSNSCATRVT